MALLLLAAVISCPAVSAQSAISRESTSGQKMLIMKDWALAACLGDVAKNKEEKDDANLSAYAFAEQGRLTSECPTPAT